MKPLHLAVFLAAATSAFAEVKLPSVFTDHMVLQREMAVPVWGKAAPGEAVTVEFAGQKKSTTAGPDGKWTVKLDAMPANAQPQVLKAGNVTVQDVLVGEVWLASGQSNMEWEMQMKPDTKSDIPNTTHPGLRLLEVPKTVSLSPQDDVKTSWATSSPESTPSFSAVGYYFGLRLHEELKVPVGILLSSWGGTRIEPWTSLEGFAAVPQLKQLYTSVRDQLPLSEGYWAANEQHAAAVEKWLQAARQARESKVLVPPLPAQPQTLPAREGTPTALYNAMIHPLVPFAIRGTIWYQGESNHNEGFVYTDKTMALLASWRKAFQQPELPFYFVQIAPWQYGTEGGEILPQFWQAQRACMDIPHTGMASISDIGDQKDIHPAHKKEVARRLSLWALAKTYGRAGIDPNGPLFGGHRIEGNTIRVKFDYADGGLASRDGKALTHFEIAGSDADFKPAEAKIDGDMVIVSSPSVPNPRRVRFAWDKLAIPNLMDKDGLPATAFNTHWPVDPDLGDNFARGCKWQSSHPNAFGWDTGLTDGSLIAYPPNAYATSDADSYPKHVTIDLGQVRKLNLVKVAVPEVGSTKTIAISLSVDGQTFRETGRHEFPLGKAERASIPFAEAEGRYLRLTYLDHHTGTAGGYPVTFSFTSEVEAYQTK